jgi:hypothetical protein
VCAIAPSLPGSKNPEKQGGKDHGCSREIALIVKIPNISPDIKGVRERTMQDT